MTRRGLIVAVLACIAAVPSVIYAHEGHVHTIRGTVTQSDDKQLVVMAEDGKTVLTITMNAKTAVLRGTQKVDRVALQVGQRVVVDVGDGKAPLVARSVKLGVVETKKK